MLKYKIDKITIIMKCKKCTKHNAPLGKDGLCEKCFIARSKQNAKQFGPFVKKITKRRRKEK